MVMELLACPRHREENALLPILFSAKLVCGKHNGSTSQCSSYQLNHTANQRQCHIIIGANFSEAATVPFHK